MNNVFIYSGGFYELIKLINLIIKNDYVVVNMDIIICLEIVQEQKR